MSINISAYTRPSGTTVVIRAHDEHGAKVAETVSKSTGYNFLVVGVWRGPTGTVRVVLDKRTNNLATARREADRHNARVVLRRHSNGRYTPADGGWLDRQRVIHRVVTETRWLTEADGDHHQVLVAYSDGRVERIGDPTRHFTWEQAQARWEAIDADRRAGLLPGVSHAMVRAEDDPQYLNVAWRRSDLKAAA